MRKPYFAPAFTEKDMAEIVKICDHIVFNSFSQWDMHKNTVQNSGRNIECGIRINPEYSEIETDIYNPCFKYSRMGVTLKNFVKVSLTVSAVCTFIQCANKIPIHWNVLLKSLMKSSENTLNI